MMNNFFKRLNIWTNLIGDGRESRHEYTEFICATSPDLYQLSHYLYDEYDSNGDHHLEKVDYDVLFDKMDIDSKFTWTECFWLKIPRSYKVRAIFGKRSRYFNSTSAKTSNFYFIF